MSRPEHCPSCGQDQWDLECLGCGALVCGFCGVGNSCGDRSCCSSGEHCACQTIFGKFGGFIQPCLQSACLPWVAAFIELVSWQWQEFETICESEIEAQAVREAMLTGGPQALAHYQLWRLPFVAARHSARALARL